MFKWLVVNMKGKRKSHAPFASKDFPLKFCLVVNQKVWIALSFLWKTKMIQDGLYVICVFKITLLLTISGHHYGPEDESHFQNTDNISYLYLFVSLGKLFVPKWTDISLCQIHVRFCEMFIFNHFTGSICSHGGRKHWLLSTGKSHEHWILNRNFFFTTFFLIFKGGVVV